MPVDWIVTFAVVLPASVSNPLGLRFTVPVSGLDWKLMIVVMGIPRILSTSWIVGMFAEPLIVPDVRSVVALIVAPGGNVIERPRFLSVTLPLNCQLVIGTVMSPVSGVVRAPAGSVALTSHVLGAVWPASRCAIQVFTSGTAIGSVSRWSAG